MSQAVRATARVTVDSLQGARRVDGERGERGAMSAELPVESDGARGALEVGQQCGFSCRAHAMMNE